MHDALQAQGLSALLVHDRDLASRYGLIVEAAMRLVSSDMGSLQIFHPERDELHLATWRGFHPLSAAHWEWVGLESSSSCGVSMTSGGRVLVPDTEAWDVVAGSDTLREYRRSGIRAIQSTPLTAPSGQLLGMISTHWREPHTPTESELRLLDLLARQAAGLIAQSDTEERPRGGTQRLRWLASIVETSNDAIESIDLDGTITSWNRGAERIFGYTAEEVLGRPITIIIPPDRHTEELGILERIRRGERIENYETVRRRKDGSSLPISLSVSPIANAEARIVGASKIARDITQQKRSEERIAALAREAEHRTRNILATVQATVNLSQSESADDLKRVILGRIQALANVHALFVESRWVGAELSNLAAQELAPYLHRDGTRAHIAGPQVLLAPDIAQTIAVVLHELTTNAAKYGALSSGSGHVDVAWTRADGGRVVLDWTESGGPPVVAPQRQGFGTRIMTHTVTGTADGAIDFDWRADGLRCRITVRA